MNWKFAVVIVAFVAMASIIGVGVYDRVHKSQTPACYAGPDEKCPDAEWLQGYDEIMAYQKKYSAPQEEQDRMNGVALRLNKTQPLGYDWDVKKRVWVKKPQVQVAPPPAAPPVKP
jgi:hypothetical protein